MTARAGIVVTGTEVLTGRIVDSNGPWLAERMLQLGIDVTHTVIVGDRPEDLEKTLGWFSDLGVDMIVTTGGLGPTEDDLTLDVVARFQGLEMTLDPVLEARVGEIQETALRRWPHIDRQALRAGQRKQAIVPNGATVLDPVGTAPGVIATPADGNGPAILVLPGPPAELRAMWEQAAHTEAFAKATSARTPFSESVLRLYPMPESEIAATLLAARERGVDVDALEITTCLRRGEVEVVTRFQPGQETLLTDFEDVVRDRHVEQLFSEDGETIDSLVARMMVQQGLTVAVAESCTGGLLAARLTELPGASRYMAGGVVVYSNESKVKLAGVDPELIERHGAVSEAVAEALARGAAHRFSADIGIGVTGVAGPDGGSEDKPVGTVCLAVDRVGVGEPRTRRIHMPGDRSGIRDRSTTVALHLLRKVLEGAPDPAR